MRSVTIGFCSLIIFWAGFPFQTQADEDVHACSTKLKNTGGNTFIIDEPGWGGVAPKPYPRNQLLPHGELEIEYGVDDAFIKFGGVGLDTRYLDEYKDRLYILEADGKYRDLGPVKLMYSNFYCEHARAEHDNWHNNEISQCHPALADC